MDAGAEGQRGWNMPHNLRGGSQMTSGSISHRGKHPSAATCPYAGNQRPPRGAPSLAGGAPPEAAVEDASVRPPAGAERLPAVVVLRVPLEVAHVGAIGFVAGTVGPLSAVEDVDLVPTVAMHSPEEVVDDQIHPLRGKVRHAANPMREVLTGVLPVVLR